VAAELFTRRGVDASSERELTSRARVNLGAITYHFGSKEALYHEAIDRIGGPFADAIGAAARTTGSALDRVEAIVRAALSHMTRHPNAPTLLLRELANDRPLPPPIARLMKRNLGALVQTIIDGQRDGSIRDGDPNLLALSVVAQPFYFRVASRIIEQALGIDSDAPQVWAKVVDHVVASVRYSIARHPKADR
jgi:AcrR family transcriptional regulator